MLLSKTPCKNSLISVFKSNTPYEFFQGCPKQFPSITSLLVHHSVMPEMLPCPLSLNLYNPTLRPAEEAGANGDQDNPNGSGGGDYLDTDQAYEIIAQLREGLLRSHEESVDQDEEGIYQLGD